MGPVTWSRDEAQTGRRHQLQGDIEGLIVIVPGATGSRGESVKMSTAGPERLLKEPRESLESSPRQGTGSERIACDSHLQDTLGSPVCHPEILYQPLSDTTCCFLVPGDSPA